MKKRVHYLLMMSVMLSLFTMNGRAVQMDAREQVKAVVETAYAGEQLAIDQTDWKSILSEFPVEICYVQDTCDVSMDELNEETLTLLKREAILNLNNSKYRFADLMDRIAIACAEGCIENGSLARNATEADQPEVTITVIRPFGPLRGNYFMKVATGTARTYEASGTVSIAAGTEIAGIVIEADLSKTVAYTCTGPADGTKLYNNKIATHRMAFGVLFGTIVKHEVEYPDGETYTFHYVQQQTMDAVDYTTLILIGAQSTYADSLKGETLLFEDQNELYSEVETNPERFIP